ncbi:MAG TPA: hypothetical protein PL048_19270 [Leptospiraceae bacterium]|nr:hypothetical protein [Leptospiraceae bacterium]
MIYSFETFTSIFLQEIEGKIYGGSIVALGNSDMVIHAEGKKYFIEVKKYCSPRKSEKGKTQPACYVKKAGLRQGVYPVFLRKNMDEDVSDCSSEIIDEINIKTYIIRYDEEKDFLDNRRNHNTPYPKKSQDFSPEAFLLYLEFCIGLFHFITLGC